MGGAPQLNLTTEYFANWRVELTISKLVEPVTQCFASTKGESSTTIQGKWREWRGMTKKKTDIQPAVIHQRKTSRISTEIIESMLAGDSRHTCSMRCLPRILLISFQRQMFTCWSILINHYQPLSATVLLIAIIQPWSVMVATIQKATWLVPGVSSWVCPQKFLSPTLKKVHLHEFFDIQREVRYVCQCAIFI